MADYEPLISRAVAGLQSNTGENRRVLYERARTALVAQLRGVDPPLEEGDITRERLSLEEAIRKVEADAAAAEQAATEAEAKPEQEPEPEAEVEAQPPEPPAAEPPRVSLGDRGLRSFRESMSEAEGLGEASAEANRAARQTYGTVSGEPAAPPTEETHYFEPEEEPGPAPSFLGEHETEPVEPADHAEAADHAEETSHGAETGRPGYEDVSPFGEHPEHADEAYAPPTRSYGRLIAALVALLVVFGLGATAYWQRDTISSMVAGLQSSKPAPAPTEQAAKPPVQPKIADRIGPSSSTPPAVAGKTADAAGEQTAEKPATAEQPAAAPTAAVAQKVVLYEEDPKNPQGKRYVGSAIWRTETVSPGPGLAPELAVRADVEIPERHLRMTWSLRRNTDKALPASHTIEITFTLPADFDEGGIGNVPGVLMKNGEQARGIPLAGLSVKVTNGYFLIGLSSVDIDKKRNIDLLKTRGWFDIPIVYTSGKRAILAMEKGPPGDRAFAEAFRAWGE